ncbi:Conserved_hypothetical protein [Hexamita inflata]|uniref:Uncharacterized protein n=1 Tax=Hexamita inflata TaxID=28002 RepID=A0AA86PNK5_9EUKA|nr:Conserved hypothetical protein [Hexamita inflata]
MDITQQYWPLQSDVIHEFQFSLFSGSVPYPIWSWIPESQMGNVSAAARSKQIAKLSMEGETLFYMEQNDVKLSRKIVEKVFHPSNKSADIIIVSAQMYLPSFSQKDMQQFMIQNNLTDFIPSRDYVTVDHLNFESFQSIKPPCEMRCCDVPSLILSSQERVTISLTAALNVDAIAQTISGLPIVLNTVQSTLRRGVIWLRNCLRHSNTTEVRRILSSKINQIIESACICSKSQTSEFKPVDVFTPEIHFENAKRTFSTLPESLPVHQSKIDQIPLVNDLFSRSCESFDPNKPLTSESGTLLNYKLNYFKDKLDSKYEPLQKPAKRVQSSSELKEFSVIQMNQELPLTIWNHSTKFVDNLYRISKDSKYTTEDVYVKEEELLASYHNIQFTDQQIQQALKNIYNKNIIDKILSGFYANQFRAVIIGPPHICNLLARSLSVLLPPYCRSKIIYAQEPENISCYFCDTDEFKAKLRLPMSEKELKNVKKYGKHINIVKPRNKNPDEVMQSIGSSCMEDMDADAERNTFTTKHCCRHCGKFRHMPSLVSGALIQCVSGTDDSFHILDYFLQLEKVSCIVNLCAQEELVVENFGFSRVFQSIQQQIMKFQIRGENSFLYGVLKTYKLHAQLVDQGVFEIFKQPVRVFNQLQLLNSLQQNMAQYLAEVAIGHSLVQLNRSQKAGEYIDVDTVYFKKNKNPFLKLNEQPDFDFVLFSSSDKIISFDRLKNGAICFNSQFLNQEKENLGSFYSNQLLKLMDCPVVKLREIKYTEVFYRYLIEYFVSEVIELLEMQEVLSVSTMNV